MNNKKAIFESMPAHRALAKFALPTILSQLISLIYNLADTYFVGNTNDPNKVAAVTLSLTPAFLLIALANLFGVGGGSLISRLLGESAEEEAAKVSAFSFYCTVGISVVYAALCFFLTEPFCCFWVRARVRSNTAKTTYYMSSSSARCPPRWG